MLIEIGTQTRSMQTGLVQSESQLSDLTRAYGIGTVESTIQSLTQRQSSGSNAETPCSCICACLQEIAQKIANAASSLFNWVRSFCVRSEPVETTDRAAAEQVQTSTAVAGPVQGTTAEGSRDVGLGDFFRLLLPASWR